MISEHNLRRVTNWNDGVFEQCLAYFKQFPENEEWFDDVLKELAWRNKFIGKFRNHISLTAVPLATKIYDQLGIITFPFIQRVACRGWDTSGGTWAWSMQTVFKNQYTQEIGSVDPVRYLLRKDVKLYSIDGYNSNGEIGGGKVNG